MPRMLWTRQHIFLILVGSLLVVTNFYQSYTFGLPSRGQNAVATASQVVCLDEQCSKHSQQQHMELQESEETHSPRKSSLTRSVTKSTPSENDCPICLQPIDPNDKKSIDCTAKHSFHKACIERWLDMKATCPYCREEIKVPERQQELATRTPYDEMIQLILRRWRVWSNSIIDEAQSSWYFRPEFIDTLVAEPLTSTDGYQVYRNSSLDLWTAIDTGYDRYVSPSITILYEQQRRYRAGQDNNLPEPLTFLSRFETSFHAYVIRTRKKLHRVESDFFFFATGRKMNFDEGFILKTLPRPTALPTRENYQEFLNEVKKIRVVPRRSKKMGCTIC